MLSEVRPLLKLALPLIVGQLSHVAMAFVDTVMAGRLSALDLAAVAIGATVWSSLTLFLIGCLMAIPAFVSQYDGAGERSRIGPFLRQCLWAALVLAAVVFVLVRSGGLLLGPLGIEAEVVPLASSYLQAVSWGAWPLAIYLLMRFFSEGIGLTKPTMYIGLLGLAINVPADYVLMYGKFGLPRLGAAGCGYATALVTLCQAVALVIYVHRARAYRFAHPVLRPASPDVAQLRAFFAVGIPIGFSIFVESSLFVSATLLMGILGTVEVAAHQVALNFAALSFMLPLGVSMAMTVRVGNAAGRQDIAEARRRAHTGFAVVLCTQLASAALMISVPEWIAALYTRDAAVATLAVQLLYLAAIFQLPDGLQAAAAGALRGLKDTRVPLLWMTLSYWVVGIPLSWALGLVMGHHGRGIWVGLIAGLTVAATLLLLRFRRLTRVAAPLKRHPSAGA